MAAAGRGAVDPNRSRRALTLQLMPTDRGRRKNASNALMTDCYTPQRHHRSCGPWRIALAPISMPASDWPTGSRMRFDPGDADSLDLAPESVPERLHSANYPERLLDAFNRRNPFY